MSGDSAEQLLLACRRHPLAAELSRGLDRARVEQGARVLVAASGGADGEVGDSGADLEGAAEVVVAGVEVGEGELAEGDRLHERTADWGEGVEGFVEIAGAGVEESDLDEVGVEDPAVGW